MSFEANVRQGEGYAVIDFHGEIQSGADDALSAAYVDAAALSGGALLLNFADVTYINSTGIALIVGMLAEARKSNRRMIACGLSDHYKEIFEITRISDFITMTDDESSAALAAQG